MWLIWHFIYSVNHSRQVEWRSLYMADTWSVYTINKPTPWPFHIMMSVVRTAVWVSFYGLPTWKCFAVSWDWKQSFIIYGNGYFLSVRGKGVIWFLQTGLLLGYSAKCLALSAKGIFSCISRIHLISPICHDGKVASNPPPTAIILITLDLFWEMIA